MIRSIAFLLAGLLFCGSLAAEELFYTYEQIRGVTGPDYGPKGVEGIFSTPDAVEFLNGIKRVRMLPRQVVAGDKEEVVPSFLLEKQKPIKYLLAKTNGIVDVPEALFRPALKLAADFSNYGDGKMCGFQTGATLFLGGEEPDYVVLVCFTCHEAIIIRRPTEKQAGFFCTKSSISPEFEKELLHLAKKMFPRDEELQKLALKERIRSKVPMK